MAKLEHKEERFLFPCYPLLCFSAGLSLTLLGHMFSVLASSIVSKNTATSLRRLAVGTVCLIATALSLSRIVSMHVNYHAPYHAWEHIYSHVNGTQRANVCVDKEWYRFPSSFFMPSENVRLRYVKSGFNGQLPQYYSDGANATRIVHSYFNDLNVGDTSRFTPISKCDYFVDLELENPSEPHLSKQTSDWRVVFESKFLDQAQSSSWLRAWFVPRLSAARNVFGRYVVLERQRKNGKK